MIEQNDILQFHGIAHHAVFAHQGAAPDECTVANFGVCTDDAANGISVLARRGNLCMFKK